MLLKIMTVLLLLGWATTCRAEENSQPVGLDVGDVQTVVGYFGAAWNQHRPQAMAEQWTIDGDMIDSFGKWARSRAGVERLFAEQQNGMMRDSSILQNVIGYQFITPDVALLDIEITISGMRDISNIAQPLVRTRAIYILKKITGKWWIASARFYPIFGAAR